MGLLSLLELLCPLDHARHVLGVELVELLAREEFLHRGFEMPSVDALCLGALHLLSGDAHALGPLFMPTGFGYLQLSLVRGFCLPAHEFWCAGFVFDADAGAKASAALRADVGALLAGGAHEGGRGCAAASLLS